MARTRKEKEKKQQEPAAPSETEAGADTVDTVTAGEQPELAAAPKPAIEPETAAAAPSEGKTDVEAWKPKTDIGLKVKEGRINDLKQIFEQGGRVREAQIVDALMPNTETDLLLVGQAKGKFGGGQRRVFKQTQKKTMEGNKPKFSAYAVVGNRDGFVGIGKGKAKETVPAREKSFRNARLNIRIVRRGCGSWQCNCRQPHSVPYTVIGKCGSVRIKLIPAPKGKGLVSEKECQKIFKLAGIKDVWTKTYGSTGTKANLIRACVNALEKLVTTKTLPASREAIGMVDGPVSVYEKALPAAETEE